MRQLLPGAPGCMVLAISRDSLAGFDALNSLHRLEIDILPPAAGATFINGQLVERLAETATA